MDTILHDLRYAFRVLARNPGFTLIAILTLALGIGANTAIFSVVNAVLLRPLPFRDPARLVIVAEKSPYPVISTSYQNWMDWRDQNHSFESLEASRGTTLTLTGAGEPERLNARMATAGLFPLLCVNAISGRTFTQDEDRAGGTPVVLLSFGLGSVDSALRWTSSANPSTSIRRLTPLLASCPLDFSSYSQPTSSFPSLHGPKPCRTTATGIPGSSPLRV
jgi:MacB-like periplasmic core domain